MNEEINRKVRYVRSQISNMFTGKVNEDVFMDSNILPKIKTTKTKSMIEFPSPKNTKIKEQLLLPNISIHRNPMSYVTDREVFRCKPFVRRKTVTKGAFYYKMALKNSTENVNWDDVISTCSRLINRRSS
jgi:hypothetical protein